MNGTYTVPDFGPADLLTSNREGTRRVRVDVGQTGFFERRQIRFPYELTALADTPQVIRVTVPVNFIIQKQSLEVDQGGIVMRAYRAGTVAGVWTPVPYYSNNFMTEQPEYAFQTVIDTGGTFTPTGPAVEIIRVRTAGATAQQSSVTGIAGDERGLAAGTYYLVFSRMTGVNGDCKGVYNLIIEERP